MMAAMRSPNDRPRQESTSGPVALAINPRDELAARLWTAGVLVFVALVTFGFFAVRSYYPRAIDAPKLGLAAPFKT